MQPREQLNYLPQAAHNERLVVYRHSQTGFLSLNLIEKKSGRIFQASIIVIQLRRRGIEWK